MKIIIDTDKQTVEVQENDANRSAGQQLASLYSDASYELLSNLTLKVGWNQKVPYTYSWMGFPILQIPDDMIRMAEVINRLKPDIIIETGVAMGGSLIFYASLLKAMDCGGLVIGVEKGLRCRDQIEAHPLSGNIVLIEGDSVAPDIVEHVHELCVGSEKVLVILDSCHSYQHVANELMAYHDLIQPGFYIVATDGNMQDLADVPRGNPDWEWDNPQRAAKEFAIIHNEFIIEQPVWPFNESTLAKNTTYWPGAWLKRL